MFKKGKKIAVSLLGILSALCIAGGVSACKNKSNPMMAPENATTVRTVTPNDGSLPTAHEPLENIGYMAYTLDNQAFYHAYAHNSTKSMGYEQVTQTWKDYKSAASTGIGESVMICSDISYSTLAKSALQTCSVGAKEAYVRGGSKPGKNTTATTEGWSGGAPEYYDKGAYYHKYGEFSTELCVYVINEYTLASASEVTVKEDGTYEQTYYLNEQAGCWYQYKMKTNGNLKKYPKFEHVQITFNFDSSWRVLSSYCTEKIEITPKALGGIAATSNSKTSTTFYYGESDFDNAHFAYFDDYFRQHLGTRPGTSGGGEIDGDEPDVITLLGSGFKKVVDPNGNGQQFNLNLTLGETEYVGRAYAKLSDMDNVLGSLDVRLALEKKGSGRQDLYIEFKNGNVNVYYSDDFALTVNIGSVGTVINQFKDWIKIFAAPANDASPARCSLADGEEEASGIGALLSQLKEEFTADSAYVTMATDNLMGTGIGVNLNIDFNRVGDGEGGSSYSFRRAGISSITYDSTSIKLSAAFSPDDSGAAPISRVASSTAADLADYMNSVYEMLNSDTLKVDLTLDGDGEGVISALNGADVALTAYLGLGNELSLKTDISASYGGVSAKLSAYYGINLSNGGYGTVYLNLTELNGKTVDGKVYCDISRTVEAVGQLVSSVSGAQTRTSAVTYSEGSAAGLAQIINKALCLDFGKIFGDIYASNSQIRLSLDIDGVISGMGVDANGLKFGTAALALNNGEKASFNLALPALGFTAAVSGSDEVIVQPDAKDYLDVIEVVNLVNRAAGEARKIIDAKDIAFDIDVTVIADGIPLSVKGRGEVVWADGNVKLALDVTLAVADGTSSAAKKDGVDLKLVYDPAADSGSPVAAFTVNKLGMKIYQSDLDGAKQDFDKLTDSINTLLGGNKTGNATPEQAVMLDASYDTANHADVSADIRSILTSGNVQSVLKAVMGFVSDISSVELRYDAGDEVNGLIIRHAVNGSLTLGADGNLSVALEANDNNGTRLIEGNASVAAGNGSAFAALEAEFGRKETADGTEVNVYTFYTASEANEKFVKIVYNYMFAVIEDLSIADVLGGKTYEVKVKLDGNRSEIPALQDITVNADIYYTEALDGDKIVNGKLAEADVDLNIKGVAVKLNARYNSGYIFLDLRTIDNYTFDGIKVKAHTDDIYSVCEQVADLITSKAVLDLISDASNGNPESGEAASALSLVREDGAKASLAGVLEKLLTLDFKEAFDYKKVDGVNTATIEIDYILNHLGVAPAYDIGVITVGVNPATHKITADITLDGNKWLDCSAEAADRRGYGADWQNGYIDISFVSSLLSDIAKTAVKDDKINTMYTLTGSIDIGIHASIISIDFTVSNVKLSAGLDENGEFYLTLAGHLPHTTYSGFQVTKNMDISVTYSGGYITLGRQNDEGENIYKVMTLEFFLDNLFDANNSPVRWLLGTSSWAWDKVCSALNINIDSGLTKPQSYYLYNQTQKPKEDKTFALGDILKGLSVKVDGKTASYGDNTSAASKWGLTDNYYALDINGEKLTNGTVKTLYAAILRDGEKGVTGLRAFAAVAGALEVNLKLDNLTTESEAPSAENPEVMVPVPAPDYFKYVKQTYSPNFGYYDGATENASTHTTPVFGCYSTEPASEADRYESSDVLSPVTLMVIGYGGAVESQSVDLRYGSTVYLINSFSPVWANEEHTLKIVYEDAAGNPLGSDIVLNDEILDENRNLTVKAVTAEVVELTFRIGLGGIKDVVAALAPDEELTAYDHEIAGYTFVGWYNDDKLTQRVTTADGVTNSAKTVYGKFVENSVTVNGVIYTFTADESESGGHYTITGSDAAKIAPFTAESSWLILENEISDIPVTAIAAEALAGANLKNVVVPENITTIGSRAFLDNYGIKTVVITADTVYFAGKDKNTVFYGCSTANGSTDTYLHVYYNSYTAEAGSDWGHFRDGDHYIDRGSNGGVHSGGSWSFVRTVQTGVSLEALGCNILGVRADTVSAAQLVAQAIAELNGITAGSYIYAYDVTASGGYSPNGKINTITIDVQNAETFWYPVTVNGNDAYVAGEYVTSFNGITYAKAGETVTVKTDVDHYISSAVSAQVQIDADNFTFTMPDSVNGVTVTVTCESVGINEVTLKSTIAADGYTYVDGEYVSSVAVTEASVTLNAPSAEGYLFLGWAYESNGTLAFTGSTFNSDTVASSVYYAVWAYNADEKLSTETSALVSGTNPNDDTSNVKVNTLKANSFYKWYLDAELTQEAGAVNSDTTVLYAKVYYTVTFGLQGTAGSKSNFYYDSPDDHSCKDTGQNNVNVGDKYYLQIAVLEGESITVSLSDNNTQINLTYGSDTYWFRAKKTGTWSPGGSRSITSDKIGSVKIESNISVVGTI